ncbi:hypothetical protein SFUMM280S_09540 [Streptomyces fumanus]
MISASCWTQAGYSVALRPAEIGSPMIRTRGPAGWASAKARSTPGMIRPGLRPAFLHVHQADRAGVGAERVAQQRQLLAGHRDGHRFAARQTLVDEGDGAGEVLVVVAVEQRGVHEGLGGAAGLQDLGGRFGHGTHDIDTSIAVRSGQNSSSTLSQGRRWPVQDEPAALGQTPGGVREHADPGHIEERHLGQLQVIYGLTLTHRLFQGPPPCLVRRQPDLPGRPHAAASGQRGHRQPRRCVDARGRRLALSAHPRLPYSWTSRPYPASSGPLTVPGCTGPVGGQAHCRHCRSVP